MPVYLFPRFEMIPETTNEITLDLSGIEDEDAFHDLAVRCFGFPHYYGRNLDAFRDCITDIVEPTEIHLLHFSRLVEPLRTRVARYLSLLKEYEFEAGNRFAVIFDPEVSGLPAGRGDDGGKIQGHLEALSRARAQEEDWSVTPWASGSPAVQAAWAQLAAPENAGLLVSLLAAASAEMNPFAVEVLSRAWVRATNGD